MKQVRESAAASASTPSPALSPDRILTLAIGIADREGLSAVAMRRLARELGVTPMALYWHFEHKDRLIDTMAEWVVEDGELVDRPGASWKARLQHVLESLVAALRRHPWMGRLVIERVVPRPRYLGALEIMLDCQREAGLDPHVAAVVTQQSVQAVVALVDYEPRSKPASKDQIAMRDQLDALPSDQYPNIRAVSKSLTGPQDVEEYYRLGIDTIVEGIGAVARKAEPGR